jgi:hypothetical protein
MRHRPSHLICTEIRRSSRQIIINARQSNTRIDRYGTRPQLKIEITRLIQRPRIRPWRRNPHKDVVIDQHAVFVLARRVAVFLQRFESPGLARLRLKL